MKMRMTIFFLLLFLFGVNQNLCFGEPWGWQRGIEVDTGGLSRDNFPKGFVFGTATSAYQVEGAAKSEGRGPSIWDVFVSKPGNIANNATADVADDQYHRYKVLPSTAGTGQINYKGVKYYNNLIDYLLERGITPYVNLYHYDLPEGLDRAFGGWLNSKIVQEYGKYAEFCFKTFGDRVKNWMTFNEPRDIAALGYDNGIAAPGRCSAPFGNCSAGNSSTEPYIVAHNLLLSHGTAVKIYREKYQAQQNGKIGILLDFVWYEPLTNMSGDMSAAQRSRDFSIGWFLHPIVYGKYPDSMEEIVGRRLPKFTEEQSIMVKGSMDYLGLNQYTAYYMYDTQQPKPNITDYQMDWNAGFAFERNGVQIGPRANSEWLYIVPWGLYKAVMYIKDNYENPTLIITENGMDDPGNLTLEAGLHDTTRINYFTDYINNLINAMNEGANVVGYFAWSLLDNFEWTKGYTSRFGLVYVDFQNLKRYPKMSAYWFSKLLQHPTNSSIH